MSAEPEGNGGAVDLKGLTIGFLGAGNMGEAIAGALIRAGLCRPANIRMADIDPKRLSGLANTYGVGTEADNTEIFRACQVVFLAVKPQHSKGVLSGIAESPGFALQERKLLISICAGVRIEGLENHLYPRLPSEQRSLLPIIRVMPNTPALVLTAMSALSPNRHASERDLQICRTVFASMGKVIDVEERLMDAVTALSGSGPAYLFYLAEAMIEAGVQMGFRPEEADLLTRQTLEGAVRLLNTSGEAPEALRRKVTSPGGTTEAALRVLEAGQVKRRFIEAIQAAARRGRELSG